MNEAAVAKLTEAQRDCLRRVLRHQTSKDIARDLGVSPHTVDQRLRVAARTLGVATRVEAARVLGEFENVGFEAYQPSVYQSSVIASEASSSLFVGAVTGGGNITEAGLEEAVRERQLSYQVFVPEHHRSMTLPFPLHAGDENKLNAWRRIGWIAIIAVASALSFGAILSGLESLGALLDGGQPKSALVGSPPRPR